MLLPIPSQGRVGPAIVTMLRALLWPVLFISQITGLTMNRVLFRKLSREGGRGDLDFKGGGGGMIVEDVTKIHKEGGTPKFGLMRRGYVYI